ncbi:MAG: YihY/virulence factor BrkB family protein [Acidobacteriota bacterium]|nr:YihY/virulence factor BrkB family protein [Acidobacteriota bacterium]
MRTSSGLPAGDAIAPSGSVVKRFVHHWSKDHAALLAAGVSFFAVFSLAPMLALLMSVANFAIGDSAARRQLVSSAATVLNPRIAKAIGHVARAASESSSTGFTIVSVVLLIAGASAVFGHLRAALDMVMDVPRRSGRGWLHAVVAQAIAVVMVVAVILFVAATVAATSLLAMAHAALPRLPFADVMIWRVVDFFASTVLIAVLFTITIKWVPDVELRWRDVLQGAAGGALLFSVARLLLAIYFSHSSFTQSYGTASSLALVLIAIYLAVLALFGAAEWTQLLASDDAAFVRDRERRRDEEGQPARQ